MHILCVHIVYIKTKLRDNEIWVELLFEKCFIIMTLFYTLPIIIITTKLQKQKV